MRVSNKIEIFKKKFVTRKINCFRGDENNLIKRFYEAGKKYKPKRTD